MPGETRNEASILRAVAPYMTRLREDVAREVGMTGEVVEAIAARLADRGLLLIHCGDNYEATLAGRAATLARAPETGDGANG